jgi:hypothetical protein
MLADHVIRLCQGSTSHFAYLFTNVLSHKQKCWIFERVLADLQTTQDLSQHELSWVLFDQGQASWSWNGFKLDEILRVRMHVLTFAWLHTKQNRFSSQQQRGVYVANQA